MTFEKIAPALVKAQALFAPALKTSINPHLKTKYADLAACVEAVIDALNTSGIYLMQKTYPAEGGVMVETTFIHDSGEMLTAGQYFSPATKADAQGYAAALTYGRRHSLMAACGHAPEDDDGESNKKTAEKAEKKALQPYMNFAANFPKWEELIKSGKITAQGIIDKAETVGTLTKDQKAMLASVTPKEEV